MMKLSKNQLQDAVVSLATVQDLVRWAYSRFEESELFYGHGTDNAWDESSTLVLQSLSLPFDTPDTVLQSRITVAEKELIVERIAKRIDEKIPVAYLTNQAMFCGSEYYVDDRVLVPRSPIAELIEHNFEPWIDSTQVSNILDLCTGSGCIAIACAQFFPNAQIVGGDISRDCLDVANKNKELLQQSNVKFHRSDLFNQIPKIEYDIIVSNPPYVDAEDFDEIPQEFLAEPKLGLTSGEDGLDLTRQILKDASNYLTKNGILVVEVGNSAAALEQAYPTAEFLWIEFERGGHGVFVLTKAQLDSL